MPPTSTPQVFTDITVDPFVRGWLHSPATAKGDALVLTHGAGGNCNAPLLVALAETFAAAGFIVLRCDLPYRQNRPYGPPGPGDAKRDRAGLTNAVGAIKKMASGRAYLGGQSYGGRQCSILAADLTPAHLTAVDLTAKEQNPAQTIAGLLLLSYPLHPPGKPEQLRTQHFSNLHTPTLIIQGTRDPFGSIPEIEQAIKQIPGKVKLAPVEGAGHDLGFKGKARREELPRTVLKEFQSFM